MQKCSMCKKIKMAEEFSFTNKKEGKRNSRCRECQAVWYQQNKEEHKKRARVNNDRNRSDRRQLVFDYLKKNPCVDCGESDPIVLEFDHLDPSKKIDCISKMIWNSTKEKIILEINKCEVVCANCHRRRTAKQRNTFRYKSTGV